MALLILAGGSASCLPGGIPGAQRTTKELDLFAPAAPDPTHYTRPATPLPLST
ncbi:hypothetical protein [Nocardia sp. NPDC005978]|uniref:hypothetical protein n=1 Tax=unclassified Nocardia TaxID=2637762 RepID=UPI0033B04F1A